MSPVTRAAAVLIFKFEDNWHRLFSMDTITDKPLHVEMVYSLWGRHNERDGVSNHQSHDCLLNRLFRRRSKKISKPRVTGLCEGNSPVTGEFPIQRPITREMFPFDDVIMAQEKCWCLGTLLSTWIILSKGWVIISIIKCGVKLRIVSETSMLLPRWISNFIQSITRHVITYSCWDWSWSLLQKGPKEMPGGIYTYPWPRRGIIFCVVHELETIVQMMYFHVFLRMLIAFGNGTGDFTCLIKICQIWHGDKLGY